VTTAYHVRVGRERTVTRMPRGYAPRVPRGWAIIDRYAGGDPRTEHVATEPLRWHPAYWRWRWGARERTREAKKARAIVVGVLCLVVLWLAWAIFLAGRLAGL
jgi:hypothetical protein